MFDVGFAEIFLLVLIGLIVLGPEKLPRVARTLGGMVRRARSSWYSLRRSIEAELAAADVTEPLKKSAQELGQAGRNAAEALRKAGNTEVGDAADEPEPQSAEDKDDTRG